MQITDVSVTEYLDTCMGAARQQGFLWVMVLLAREHDATHSYQELARSWESFDDLTGDSILFVLSAKNEKTSHLLNYKHNPFVYVVNKAWNDLDIPHLYVNRRIFQKRNQAIYNNTLYISEIRHKYNIREDSIPAILLFKLNSNGHEKPVIIPISEDNLYETIQGLIIVTEPFLKEIRKYKSNTTSKHSTYTTNTIEEALYNKENLQKIHSKLDDAVLQYAHNIINKKNESKITGNKATHFKIGITFSGKYREKIVKPTVDALLGKGFTKNDIFYDHWHQVMLNGVNGDNTIRDIYKNRCDCVVVLLSPDYKEKNWPGHIEWPAAKELINIGEGKKLCLLGVDSFDINDIDGLYANQTIFQPVDDMSPAEIADFIYKKYLWITSS